MRVPRRILLGLAMAASVAMVPALSASAASAGAVAIAAANASAHVCAIGDGTCAIPPNLPSLTPYSFGGGVCASAQVNSGPGVAGGVCNDASSGQFINVVCGTGAVLGSTAISALGGSGDSTATISAPGIVGAGGTVSVTNLNVVFVNTVGILAGTVGTGAAAGVVDLVAIPNPPPNPVCTDSFTVTTAAVYASAS